ncbi:MAG: acetyl-CoA carboxylase biotin carboxyl carrier protein [Candidatus Firestonebacteria bacterium]|nr:acetyl-CoA carboxylase biotin carboxyl carrier protein [Candidatus Firestonebacteria bacterium]
MKKQSKKIVKVTDTTLRDAHQSLWATRMKTSEILPIAEKIDKVGYHSVEVWGGATFDVCLRFLNEDPWERLRNIKKIMKNTPLQMLLRGQNVVGYKNYPDDLLKAFIERTVKNGIDIIRIFDALNDVRNMVRAIEYTKKLGAHAQGTVCYTISPVHTIDHYIKTARELVQLGIDSLCIKDMAGILYPYASYSLVKELKKEIKIPIQLHCHSSSGMATVAYLKAIEAGVDIVDCASAPLALYTSQPPVETIVSILDELGMNQGIKFTALEEIADYFEHVAENKKLIRSKQSLIDTAVITHQIPGGMVSNLISQLEKQKALDKMEDVLGEIPKVREDFGFPPLVTPTSQIVGTQAVFNVLLGERYKVVPQEVKEYVKGFYGRPPSPIKKAIIKKILNDEQPITCRPADLLPPILKQLEIEVDKELIKTEEDLITYALFPEVAIRYFNWRNNPLEYPSDEEKLEKAMEDKKVEKEKISIESLKQIKDIIETMKESKILEFNIEKGDTKLVIKRGDAVSTSSGAQKKSSLPHIKLDSKDSSASKETEIQKDAPDIYKVKSPMIGTFYSAPGPGAEEFVKIGDVISEGKILCIVEAMKLMNEIIAEKKGKIIDILAKKGDAVEKGQVLFVIDTTEEGNK